MTAPCKEGEKVAAPKRIALRMRVKSQMKILGGQTGWGAALYRLRILSLYLLVFASGCSITAYLLNLHPSHDALEPRAARLDNAGAELHAEHAAQVLSRRGLYLSTEEAQETWEQSKPQQDVQLRSQQAAFLADHAIQLPEDFDWRSYLLRYHDLRAKGVRSRESAAWHYINMGHFEKRRYTKIPIMLRYTACQGLFNQMYAHLNALTLAHFLGADVVLPPSVYRESFSKYFSMDLTKNQVRWTPTNVSALIDVDALKTHYRSQGMEIHATPSFSSFPDCMHPQDAFPRYLSAKIKPEQIVQLPNLYLQSKAINVLWDEAAERLIAKRALLLDTGWPEDTTLVLDLPCPFLSIMTLTCLTEAQDAATALRFNRTLVNMAQSIIRGMKKEGIYQYHGAHLRLEKDAVDWARVLGGMEAYMDMYAKAFVKAGFSPHKHLYVASGLLSYNASKEMQGLLEFLGPHSKSVQYKEKYIPADVLKKLNPEQEALIDFLVLANCDKLVGIGSSTFSVYLREYRVLLGHPRTANVFIDTSKIGTDALFERSTHFTPIDAVKAQ